MNAGADLLGVQTNNATFGRTDEAVQQLAMSRIRAMERGIEPRKQRIPAEPRNVTDRLLAGMKGSLHQEQASSEDQRRTNLEPFSRRQAARMPSELPDKIED